MFVKEVTVENKVGLHARPATFFIQKANEYKSSIWVEKEEMCIRDRRERVTAAPGGNGQRRRKSAAAGFHNGLALLQLAPLGGKANHGGGQCVLAGAGGPVE